MTLRAVLLSAAAFAVLYAVINFSPIGVSGLLETTGGANILDFEFGYSVEKAYGMLSMLGEAGRGFYLTRLIPLDFPFPAASMLCFYCLISYLIEKADRHTPRMRYALLLPVLCMLFDYAENICIIVMLTAYPTVLPAIYTAAGAMTILKYVFYLAKTFAAAVLLVMAVIAGRKRRLV